jgi:hypothetical protein
MHIPALIAWGLNNVVFEESPIGDYYGKVGLEIIKRLDEGRICEAFRLI